MGEVVEMFRRTSPIGRSAIVRKPDTSMSAMRERMRRADVEDALRRLLEDAARGNPRLSLRLTRDAFGLLAVTATLDGGTPRIVSPAYAEKRLDDFAGVVRAGLHDWIRPLSARLGLRIA